jgi:hypothetical protein
MVARMPPGSAAWYWLRLNGIPETEENRAWMITRVSVVGILVSTVWLLSKVVFGNP